MNNASNKPHRLLETGSFGFVLGCAGMWLALDASTVFN
jgi:hypothetical protein